MDELGGSSEQMIEKIKTIKLKFWKVSFLVIATFVCVHGFPVHHTMEIEITHKTSPWKIPEIRITQ